MTISFWLKILSIGSGRYRYYLSSGTCGDTCGMDTRGVAIFTQGNLLGFSLSQTFSTWTIILDSSSYTIGTCQNKSFMLCV
ncbi:unnamed protein product [Protopolystoma xenopodis]|uniref:Uncharacterized protein n=1 Tax=Protopolystoma xenopodis TaxID=117903 RepID=A0A3S5AQM1_9PLAT|nr:unnamed protein product [Protopolystoma xenopodis]